MFQILIEIDFNLPLDAKVLAELEFITKLQNSGESRCKFHLAKAEFSKYQDNMEQILCEYEKAVKCATSAKNYFILGLAFERYLHYCENKSFSRFGQILIDPCVEAYEDWKCMNKADQILMKYQKRDGPRNSSVSYRKESFREDINQKFDVNTMLEVTASLNNENDLNSLLEKVSFHLMKNSGASKTVIALCKNNLLSVRAVSHIDIKGNIVFENMNEELTGYKYAPISLMNYVFRDSKTQLFNQSMLQTTSHFQFDDYFKSYDPKSSICCPITHHGTVSGIIYLENKFQPGTFTPRKSEIIESILSSASISLANANLLEQNRELSLALTDMNVKSAKEKFQFDAPITKVLETINDLRQRFEQDQEDGEVQRLDSVLKMLMTDGLFEFDQSKNKTNISEGANLWIAKPDLSEIAFVNESNLSLSSESRTSEVFADEENEISEYLAIESALDFDTFVFADVTKQKPLYYISNHLLWKYGLFETFNIPIARAFSFLNRVEGEYNPLPYHNRYIIE